MSGPRHVSEVLTSVDFIARLADAWDGRGNAVLRPFAEHRALLELAGLSREFDTRSWNDFTGGERQALLKAARRAVELGRACAWVFGEGEGARM